MASAETPVPRRQRRRAERRLRGGAAGPGLRGRRSGTSLRRSGRNDHVGRTSSGSTAKLVDEDAAAYQAFLATRRGTEDRQAAVNRVAATPLAIGRACAELIRPEPRHRGAHARPAAGRRPRRAAPGVGQRAHGGRPGRAEPGAAARCQCPCAHSKPCWPRRTRAPLARGGGAAERWLDGVRAEPLHVLGQAPLDADLRLVASLGRDAVRSM